MPFADAEFDAATCIYLFHELPPGCAAPSSGDRAGAEARGNADLRRFATPGDEPDYDAMLEYFPAAFHEPYYASYLREDFDRLMSPGLSPANAFRPISRRC